ncbi:MAG: TatD family hydrolase [Candidatus Bathyarchaeota archaeon]
MFSDAHCHFRHLPYDAVEPTVRRLEKEGVELALLAGVDVGSSEQEILNAKRFTTLKACIGIHPWNADLCTEAALQRLKELSSQPQVVAISEVGLDYFSRRNREKNEFENTHIDEKVQQTAFRQLLRLAKEVNLPVIIHDRTTSQEVLDILQEEGTPQIGAAIHGFNKNREYAKRCAEMGVYLSIGFGTLMPELFAVGSTRPLSRISVVSEREREALKETIRQTDLKWLFTDSDRAGDGIFAINEKIAEIKGLPKDEVSQATTQNLKRFLRLP